MSIKSRIKFEAFDKNNTKVKDVELPALRNRTKNSIKKLSKKPDLQVPYHLVLGYFIDEKDKVLGDFFDVGINKKLTKHFHQIEMKSGKPNDRMSASQKEASAGTIYVKEVNGKKLVHIEPSPSCKIPKGRWPKILKGLKAMLAGLKAIVVIGGETIEESSTGEEDLEEETTLGEEGTEESTTDTNDGTEDTSEETTEEESTDETPSSDTDQATLDQNRQARASNLSKIEENTQKMGDAVGRVSRPKLMGNIQKYEDALQKLIEQAESDGVVDSEEQAQIDSVTEQLETLKQNVSENGSRLTEDQQAQMRNNLNTAQRRLDDLLAEMGI